MDLTDILSLEKYRNLEQKNIELLNSIAGECPNCKIKLKVYRDRNPFDYIFKCEKCQFQKIVLEKDIRQYTEHNLLINQLIEKFNEESPSCPKCKTN